MQIPGCINQSYPVKFHVVPANFPIAQDGIMGEDFMKQTGTVIDYGSNRAVINFGQIRAAVNFINEPKTVIIPPRTEKVIKYGPVDILEESLATLQNDLPNGLFISTALVKPQNGFVYLSILNISEDPIPLPNNFFVAFAPLSNYNVYFFNETCVKEVVENRLENLTNQIEVSHLNTEEKSSILSICRKYNKLFHLEGDLLTTTTATKHTICVDPLKPPINVKPYRLAEVHKSEIKKQVDDMLVQGIVKHSDSPWNSPLLVVPKKSENDVKKWRVVVDYRRLNDLTIPDAYP